jgi:23S rRNA A1618 N6-methylase RlmF
VNRNNLQGQITIYHNRDRSQILPLDKLEKEGFILSNDEFAFSMCNPPFYGSSDEIQAGIDNKIDDPAAVSTANKGLLQKRNILSFYQICTGTESEMITEGGEIQFITNMIEESLKWKNRIK